MLVAGHALLVAFMTALAGVSWTHIQELAKSGSRRDARLARLKGDTTVALVSARFGAFVFSGAAVALGALMIPLELEPLLVGVLPNSTVLLMAISIFFVIGSMWSINLILTTAASNNPEPVARALSWFGYSAYLLFGWILQLWTRFVAFVLKPFGLKVSMVVTAPKPLEELEAELVSRAQRDTVDQDAPQLIRSIFELSDKTCRDVMVARTEVVTIELSTSVENILALIAEENHSRLPVYKDDVDNIVGILHVRDLVPMLQHQDLIVLDDLLRPVVFVPWMKRIGDLLREMQHHHIHIAVVVDEYGGFSGIVTMEDILREIVGPIRDEFEEEVKSVEAQPDDSFLVDAAISVEDFSHEFNFTFPPGDFETLGGFLAHLAGAIPDTLDRFTHSGWIFVVHSKDGPKLERIRVYKGRPTAERRPRPSAPDGVRAKTFKDSSKSGLTVE